MTGSGTADLRVTAAQVELAKLAIELRQSLGKPVGDRLRLIASATPASREERHSSRLEDFPVDSWIDAPELGGVGVVMRHVDDRLRVLFMSAGYRDVDPDSGVSPTTPPDIATINGYLREKNFDSTDFYRNSFHTDAGAKFLHAFVSHRYDDSRDSGETGVGYGDVHSVNTDHWRTGLTEFCSRSPWVAVNSTDGHITGVYIVAADAIDHGAEAGLDDPADRSARK
ncbi:hypothetical protein GCU67_20890 [Modestobacter muralis]|uniref:Uncharacterized protein n=1 Tax=Modestobacter muralis TaxID=1608614 RepID=A0A6P0F0F7_9ACTN|nr:hypothetical protein [Modestobacter muralis]NEK96603.1 hypothetical protein [Modestobacter muralis]NEN53522.1 hypothetical protein [Modestobacter muralis]